MSTPVEYGKATAEIARLRAGIEAIIARSPWNTDIETVEQLRALLDEETT